MARKRYVVERTNDIPLEFDGELLGEVTSKHDRPNQARWTEHRIYRTTTGSYVVETVGKSVVDGEIDRCSATAVDDPKEIPAALRAPRTYLTLLARDVLDLANLHDDNVPITDRI